METEVRMVAALGKRVAQQGPAQQGRLWERRQCPYILGYRGVSRGKHLLSYTIKVSALFPVFYHDKNIK